MAAERVLVYLDGEDKWRWKWWRGTRQVGASSQGYTSKQWCMANIALTLRADYEKQWSSRKTPNGREHQTGIMRRDSGEPVPIEITPWRVDES